MIKGILCKKVGKCTLWAINLRPIWRSKGLEDGMDYRIVQDTDEN